MSLYFKVAAISTLLVLSMFGKGGTYKPPRSTDKGTVKAYNKSPCFEEDVYACQASGGRFNWSHCTCEYW